MTEAYSCRSCGRVYERASDAEKCEQYHKNQISKIHLDAELSSINWRLSKYTYCAEPERATIALKIDGRPEPITLIFKLDYTSVENIKSLTEMARWAKKREVEECENK